MKTMYAECFFYSECMINYGSQKNNNIKEISLTNDCISKEYLYSEELINPSNLANSSNYTVSNCGPRNESGSCAENICAVAPFGHSNIRRPAIHFGRCSGGDTARMPLSPNTMISRACSYVSAISPIRRLAPAADGVGPSTMPRTHSAPTRVFPAPRPPRSPNCANHPQVEFGAASPKNQKDTAMQPKPRHSGSSEMPFDLSAAGMRSRWRPISSRISS